MALKYKHVSEADRKRILAMRAKGWSYDKITKKTGRASGTIRKILDGAAALPDQPEKCDVNDLDMCGPDAVPATQLETYIGQASLMSKESLALCVINSSLRDSEKVQAVRFILK